MLCDMLPDAEASESTTLQASWRCRKPRTGNEVAEVAQHMTPSLAASSRFRETLPQRLRRWVLVSAYALMPSWIARLPRLLWLTLARQFALEGERDKLPVHQFYYSERGLVGFSNDLSVSALIANYSLGYFPVRHLGAIKWGRPDERAVIDPTATHLGKNLRRLLRQRTFTVTSTETLRASWRLAHGPGPARHRSPGSRPR
jgi:leucyl/phenylalanyl-tRNA---protein transferase